MATRGRTTAPASGGFAQQVKTQTLQVRMSDDLFRFLDEVAAQQGIGASTLARMLIMKGLRDQPYRPSWWIEAEEAPATPEVAEGPATKAKRSVAETAGQGIRVAKPKSGQGR